MFAEVKLCYMKYTIRFELNIILRISYNLYNPSPFSNPFSCHFLHMKIIFVKLKINFAIMKSIFAIMKFVIGIVKLNFAVVKIVFANI